MPKKSKAKVPEATSTTPEEVKPTDTNLRKWDLALKISFWITVFLFFLWLILLYIDELDIFSRAEWSYGLTFFVVRIYGIILGFFFWATVVLSIVNWCRGINRKFASTALLFIILLRIALAIWIFTHMTPTF